MGLKIDPKKFIMPKPINISTHIKNGRREGHTIFNHRFSPSKEDLYAYSGNIIMQIIINKNIIELKHIERKLFFILSPNNKALYQTILAIAY